MRVPCQRCGVRFNVWYAVTYCTSHCPNCGHSLLNKSQRSSLPQQQAPSNAIDERFFEIPAKVAHHQIKQPISSVPKPARKNIIDPELFDC